VIAVGPPAATGQRDALALLGDRQRVLAATAVGVDQDVEVRRRVRVVDGDGLLAVGADGAVIVVAGGRALGAAVVDVEVEVRVARPVEVDDDLAWVRNTR
jgi:hypothetical protein